MWVLSHRCCPANQSMNRNTSRAQRLPKRQMNRFRGDINLHLKNPVKGKGATLCFFSAALGLLTVALFIRQPRTQCGRYCTDKAERQNLSNEAVIKDRESSQNCNPITDERCSDDGRDACFAQEQIHYGA